MVELQILSHHSKMGTLVSNGLLYGLETLKSHEIAAGSRTECYLTQLALVTVLAIQGNQGGRCCCISTLFIFGDDK